MALSERIWSTNQPATFLRFSAVACVLAVIDIGVLYAATLLLGINIYLARVASYAAAATAGYFLNRRFTFHARERTRHTVADLGRFYSVFVGGGLVNYAVFAAIVGVGHHLTSAQAARYVLPLLGVWIGGLAGMGFNYTLSRKLVFHP